MKQWARRTRVRLLRRLGIPGAIGLALLLPALVMAMWLPRLRQEAAQETLSMQARARLLAQRVAAPPVDAGEVDITRGFIADFPLLTQNARDLEALFDAAGTRRIALAKGEYQLKADPTAPFVTYSATFPIRSDYRTMSEFSADVLTRLPHVSMDEMRLARDAANTPSLDAIVRFTFVYRSP